MKGGGKGKKHREDRRRRQQQPRYGGPVPANDRSWIGTDFGPPPPPPPPRRQGSRRAQRARARVGGERSPFTRTRLLPPDTLHLPAPLPAPLPLPKTRELGNFGPSFHSMGAPPWQGSVVACLGSPWDPTGLVSGPLGLVSSRASHRPSRIACTLDSPAPLPSPAPFPKVGTLHPYPRRVNTGKRVVPLPFCCPAGRPTYVFQHAHPRAPDTTPW